MYLFQKAWTLGERGNYLKLKTITRPIKCVNSRIPIYALSAVRLLQESKDFPTFLTNYFEEIVLTIGNEVTKALVDTRATLSVLIPISLTISPPQSTETMQTVEVFKQPITVSKSLLVPFHHGPIQ